MPHTQFLHTHTDERCQLSLCVCVCFCLCTLYTKGIRSHIKNQHIKNGTRKESQKQGDGCVSISMKTASSSVMADCHGQSWCHTERSRLGVLRLDVSYNTTSSRTVTMSTINQLQECTHTIPKMYNLPFLPFLSSSSPFGSVLVYCVFPPISNT